MFKKLLASLPFNPGLLDEVLFYINRLQTESQTRRLGLIFLSFALVVQTAAALYPAEKSLATGSHSPKPPANYEDLSFEKQASNLTRGVWDANESTAQHGDELEFKLITKNTATGGFFNYSGEDYFGYVLQYADISDFSQLEDQAMILGDDGYLRWESGFIAGKSSETKTIKVKVKEHIPLTNKPGEDSKQYDCTISNEFGNSVIIKVPCPPIKVAAETATELPKTGAGVSIILGGLAAGFAGYLLARTRLMAKEMEVVRRDHISVGGPSL